MEKYSKLYPTNNIFCYIPHFVSIFNKYFTLYNPALQTSVPLISTFRCYHFSFPCHQQAASLFSYKFSLFFFNLVLPFLVQYLIYNPLIGVQPKVGLREVKKD